MKWFPTTILAIAFLLCGGAAHAGDGSKESKERVRALIQMRLTQNLGLNAQQSAQIGQIMGKYQERRHELRKAVRGLNDKLKSATASGNEAEIQKFIGESNQTRLQLEQLDGQMFNEVKPMLTASQQAKFLIEMDAIKSEIRAIRRSSQQPQGQAAGAHPASNVPPGAFSNNPNYFPPGVPSTQNPPPKNDLK